MVDLISRLIGTVLLRPYVFIFLLVFIVASFSQLGLKRTVLFLITGYLVSFASEFCSIHSGIPYGLYHYIPATLQKELWVAGVPFMDSLSYVFLAYASFSTALFLLCPTIAKGREIFLLDTKKIRRSWQVLALGAFLMMLLDIMIDPVALRGERWFLGQIYYYPDGGIYFGVPISNFIGWFLVGLVMIFLLQKLDGLSFKESVLDRVFSRLPWGALVGPALYFGVILFNVSIGFIINEIPLATVNTLYAIILAVFTAVFTAYKLAHEDAQEITKHLQDFPRSRFSWTFKSTKVQKL